MKLLATLALAMLLTACFQHSKQNDSFMPQPSDDLEVISRFVQLPYKPVHVQFQTAPLGHSGGLGPNDWTLAAVLSLSAADFETASASCKKGEIPAFDRPLAEKHFPWLKTEIGTGPVAACDATPYLRSPLNTGSAYLLDNNRLFLMLSTT